MACAKPVGAQQQTPCTGFGVTQVAFPPQGTPPSMPTNFSPLAQQIGADCLAWQEFVYLNWAADPNKPGQPNASASTSAFGTPNDTSNTVWQSYFDVTQVFNPPAGARPAFSAPRPQVLTLSRLSKLGDTRIQIGNVAEASGGWLTNQRRQLTYYQILINQDEYDFITTNVLNGSDLTTYAGQLACASNAGINGVGGFNLPAGNGNADTDCTGKPATYWLGQGTIEIKAAWTPLPPDGSLNYRYKIATATLTDPNGNTTQATVGLVGLHIIHKYPGATQFVWATFEQIDNSPDDDNGRAATWPALPPNPNQKPSPGYTFFNPNCTPTTDPTYNCARNVQPTSCLPKPPPAGCQPFDAPMQVTRITPVEQVANSVTQYAWSLLPNDSVFNYYRLIDVLWPNSPSTVPPQSRTPLSGGDIQPPDNSRIVANTTLETFVQKQLNCMDCHQYAPIALKPPPGLHSVRPASRIVIPLRRDGSAAPVPPAPSPYASDYSFVFKSETSR
jgi:hypothetical protein